MLAIVVLFFVFVLIAVRQIGDLKLKIWQVMLLGALAVILTGNISFKDAIKSINFEVIIFLFSMFVIGAGLERSGYLAHITYKFFKRAKTVDQLFLYILFIMGLASSILMNDTIAIIGTPVMLLLSKKYEVPAKILLLSLAFAVTIGSVTTPIGNPQNFIIATNVHLGNSFLIFLKYLFIPTIVNLFFSFLILKLFFKKEFRKVKISDHSQRPIKDHQLSFLSKISIYLLLVLIILKVIFSVIKPELDIKLVYITTISCLPILIFSRKRIKILRSVDYPTLIFFASMFILMEAVWRTGFFQKIFFNSKFNVVSLPVIMFSSIILSQFISNVPLVALYLPMIKNLSDVKTFMILAASSTIAGNLTILGAASNIIIIHTAETKLKQHNIIKFTEFFKVGSILTLINAIVYLVFIYII